MRTLTLAGIYIAPVAAFAVVASVTGFSTHLVDYSEFEGQSVVAKLYEFDGENVLDLVANKEAPSETETTTAYVTVASADTRAVQDDSSSVLYKDTFFGIQDISAEAIAAEFDDLIDTTAAKPGFVVSATATKTVQPFQVAAANTPLSRAVQTAVAKASFGKANFGSTGGAGSNGATGTAAFTPTSGISDPSTTAPNPVSPLPSGTGLVPVTAGLSSVPLPASSVLLLAGLAVLGGLSMRRRS